MTKAFVTYGIFARLLEPQELIRLSVDQNAAQIGRPEYCHIQYRETSPMVSYVMLVPRLRPCEVYVASFAVAALLKQGPRTT